MKFVPTIRMVLEAYPKIAAVERMRMERPCEKSVASVVSGVRRLCEIGEISLSTSRCRYSPADAWSRSSTLP